MGMGKVNVVQRELRDFFNEWELGICVLLSLFLQILLILAGPLRKIVSRKWLDILLWSAYLLADGTAVFAVGLISSKHIGYSNHYLNAPATNRLHTFWAPFLLAHLGGPDPITAFALEDNELWLRHLFSLFTQSIAVAYVIYQSLTPNELLVPSLLMFLCGLIKYAERTYALYCANANTFRDSILREPEPIYESFNDDSILRTPDPVYTNFNAILKMFPEPDRVINESVNDTRATCLKSLEAVQYAFHYFTNFKGLVVDLIFTPRQRDQSREFFLARTSNDAFRVVEVELNFFYDILFTKLPVVYYPVGFGCRAVSVGAIVTSLVLFHYVDKKHFKPEGFEVGITYTLLIGGIVLEVIAFFMLVFSDWTVMKLKLSLHDENPSEQSWKRTFIDFIMSANVRRGKMICWLLNIGGVHGSGIDSESNPRWAESISGYNIIYYCLYSRSKASERIYDKLGIRDFLDEMVYVEQHPLPCYLKDFIFQELRIKSEMAKDLESAKKICSSKGEWALGGYSNSEFLSSSCVDVDYDESLLLWHIATELCYNDEEDKKVEGEQGVAQPSVHHRRIAKLISEDKKVEGEQGVAQPPVHHRRIAKLISDYMIYLLVMKPGMMSAVSRIGLIRFRDSCNEAKTIFNTYMGVPRAGETRYLQACKRIMELLQPTRQETGNLSILFKAARLGDELKKREFQERWEMLSKVWVELLSYGASHIKSNAHAQQLSKGGQLITVVWLLMTQLGLGDQFQPPYDDSRAQELRELVEKREFEEWKVKKSMARFNKAYIHFDH